MAWNTRGFVREEEDKNAEDQSGVGMKRRHARPCFLIDRAGEAKEKNRLGAIVSFLGF
jgi:hypothetical protein